MARPVLIPIALLALAAGGCSLSGTRTASSGSFTGVAGKVAVTLNTFQSDASSNNAGDMCKNVLDRQALARLARVGTCTTIITNQLKTISDFGLTIESIHVQGRTATATVRSTKNGKKVLGTIRLVEQPAGWRIDSFG